jgi:hypothetical protein
MEINTRDRPIGLNRLALELRNIIYEYVIGDCTTLTIPPSSCGSSALQSFHKKLPPCLLLNHQILAEATDAFIHRTMLVVEEVKLSQPEDLLSVLPSNTTLMNLHRLEFTQPQSRYSKDSEHSPVSVHEVVKRCPRLQELTIPFRASMFLGEQYHSDFSHIFEHEKLSKLCLTCKDSPQLSSSYIYGPDHDGFVPFDNWFLRECEERSRQVALSIDLSPDSYYNPNNGEFSRGSAGSIKWTQYTDWFG